jgi:hypothetical protein
MHTLRLAFLTLLTSAIIIPALHAQVPRLINYQGRVAVNAVNFDGPGQFKFALVDSTGAITYWSNDGTSAAGSEPAASVTLTVSKGLYSVLLGDSTLANMSAIPASVFTNADVRLRVWFNDGVNGSQLLTPDQRLAPSPYLADASVDFNRLAVPANPTAGQLLGFDGASLKWQPAITGGDSIFSLNGNNASFLAGGVGLGTPVPQARLHVYESADSATQVIETGGDTNAWAKLAFRNGNGDWHIGTSRNYNHDIFYIDRISTTPVDFQFSTSGALGLSIEPQAKLHLYEPASSVSHRIQTSAGTNAWTRVEFVNDDGQWNLGTSRNYNDNQLYFHRQGSDQIAFAVQPNGDVHYQGRLGKLDTNEQFAATVRAADFLFGHSQRRGAPGRAMVDWRDTNSGNTALILNFAGDWGETHIGGRVTQVNTLRIIGGADLAEPFAMPAEIPKGSVVVIDEANPGQLKLSTEAYDARVAGIVSGANGINPGIALHQEGVLEGGQHVALSGRVYVHADASRDPIKPGDMLTTSDTPGHAMKATDRDRAHGTILGKAMTGLDHGQGMVLVLVTLQ